jgi:hypothetical protein
MYSSAYVGWNSGEPEDDEDLLSLCFFHLAGFTMRHDDDNANNMAAAIRRRLQQRHLLVLSTVKMRTTR